MREKKYYKDMKGTQEEEKGTRTMKKQNIEKPAARGEKLAQVRKVAKRLRRKIKRDRLAIVHDRRLGDVDYLETVEAHTCGELGTEDAEPTEILLSVTYGAGLPAAQAEAIEDALLSSVKALPFPADDIFRGTGDGTREYAALFVL
jgi:hypothetical protein